MEADLLEGNTKSAAGIDDATYSQIADADNDGIPMISMK